MLWSDRIPNTKYLIQSHSAKWKTDHAVEMMTVKQHRKTQPPGHKSHIESRTTKSVDVNYNCSSIFVLLAAFIMKTGRHFYLDTKENNPTIALLYSLKYVDQKMSVRFGSRNQSCMFSRALTNLTCGSCLVTDPLIIGGSVHGGDNQFCGTQQEEYINIAASDNYWGPGTSQAFLNHLHEFAA